MSMSRLISCVVGKECLLWPECSFDKALLAFALIHFVLQGQTCLLFQVSLDFLFLHSKHCTPTMKWHFVCVCVCVCVLVQEGVVGLHKTGQLYLLQHQRFWHRLELLWCRLVCLWNELISFCCFWVCMQVLHFGFVCWLWGLVYFF